MSVPPPKNARINLAYKRLFDHCQKNNITITNLFNIHLSATSILIGPCITNGCKNQFEKTYGDLIGSNGYCTVCTSKTQNIKQSITSNIKTITVPEIKPNIKTTTAPKPKPKIKTMSTQEINQYIKNHTNDPKRIFLLPNVKIDYSGLICGGFKTGTCTLQHTFLFPRTHTLFLSDLKTETLTNLIILFRDNESVYRSALFQDITQTEYEYSPFSKGNFLEEHKHLSEKEKQELINKIDVNQLIQHYNKVNWDKYISLNNRNRLAILNSYYRIQINYNSKGLQVFRIETENNKTLKIIALHTDTINNHFEELKTELYGSLRQDIVLKKDNISSDKWYSSKYKEFLDNIDKVKIIKPIY